MKTTEADLRELARQDVVVDSFLKLKENHGFTLEQVLIAMVFTLVQQKGIISSNYTEHLRNCTMPRINGL